MRPAGRRPRSGLSCQTEGAKPGTAKSFDDERFAGQVIYDGASCPQRPVTGTRHATTLPGRELPGPNEVPPS